MQLLNLFAYGTYPDYIGEVVGALTGIALLRVRILEACETKCGKRSACQCTGFAVPRRSVPFILCGGHGGAVGSDVTALQATFLRTWVWRALGMLGRVRIAMCKLSAFSVINMVVVLKYTWEIAEPVTPAGGLFSCRSRVVLGLFP